MPSHSRLRSPSLVTLVVVIGLLLPTLWVINAQAFGPTVQTEPTPTVDACAPPTAVLAVNAVSVRSGPGQAYQLLEAWRTDQVRPVIGRHGFYEWWQIELSEGVTGWVWDGGVEVRGDIASVPIVTPPGEDQAATANLAPWEPVPLVECVATTITDTVEIAATPTAGAGTPVAELNANNDGWNAAVNLSNSGAASDPVLLVDGAGNILALWQEGGLEGMVFVQSDGNGWSAPVAAEFPFATRRFYPDLRADESVPVFSPLLRADETNGIIHALWTDENSTLWHSQVPVEAFGDFAAWSQRSAVREGVAGVNAAVGADATLHISYMSQEETVEEPAGVYYQRSSDTGSTWSSPVPLYQTRYAISLPPDGAQTQIVTDGAGEAARIFVGWEIGPLQKVFLARSYDGGVTWQGQVLDQRDADDLPSATAPSDLLIGIHGETVLALWQAGHEAAPCTQYYDWSEDGGKTWHGRQPMLESLLFCPSDNQLLIYPDATPLLLSVIDEQPYLLAWNGTEWSTPQAQELLAGFVNPETFAYVKYGCQQAGRAQAGTLVVVGCESSEDEKPGDIWGMERTLDDVEVWFAPPSPWSDPAPLGELEEPLAALEATGTDSGVHAFWHRIDGQDIYHAKWDGTTWTRPTAVLSVPGGAVRAPAAAAGPSDTLFVVWPSTEGGIYFSRAEAEESLGSADWSAETLLPMTEGFIASGVDIEVAPDGTIVVVYSVPLNERRGIYVMRSADGENWSEPLQVFDAAGAGWNMVGAPDLALAENGVMHVIWGRQALPVDGTARTTALYASLAEAGADAFATAESVFEGPTLWYGLATAPGGTVHRLWQEEEELTTVLWHEISHDSGQIWEVPRRIPAEDGPVTLTQDRSGGLHLLQLSDNILWHWVGNGAEWRQEVPLDWQLPLAPITASTIGHIAAAIDSNGHLATAFDARMSTIAEVEQLLFTAREIETAAPSTTPLPEPTATVTATATPAVTPTPQATRANAGAGGGEDGSGFGLFPSLNNDPVMMIIVSILPVALVVLLVLVSRLVRTRVRRSP